VQIVLISTYEMGRQPFGLASPAAWLREAGFEVACFDLSRQRLDETVVARAGLVVFYLPMHTATRLAGPVIDRVRRVAPGAHLCACGLYASLTVGWLRRRGIDSILGGEFEEQLVALARFLAAQGPEPASTRANAGLRTMEIRTADMAAPGETAQTRGRRGSVPPDRQTPGPAGGAAAEPGRPWVAPPADPSAVGLRGRDLARWGHASGAPGPIEGQPDGPTAWRPGDHAAARPANRPPVPRLAFRVPDRRGLPSPDRYAALVHADGRRRPAGYTEATRGCKHLCRHCPVVPVYGGQFRVVPLPVVLADIRQQVEAGATHITFGDPDFFNGIGHARALVRALARTFPGLTYDVTIKVEHLVKHAGELPLLRDTGCVLVTSAIESIDDEVLVRLAKGHTRADAERAIERCRETGLGLAPTFVAFTPWTTIDGYAALLEFVAAWDLVEQVAPIQLALRLLVTAGSRLLELPEIRSLAGPLDPDTLVHPWRHPDPRVEALHDEVEQLVERLAGRPRRDVFAAIRALAARRRGRAAEGLVPYGPDTVRRRVEVVWLDEPWYC
jgi:radical SAM superfamily enzyme YgiQ (UPF0313 family)